jgi:hypothetical protein
MSVPDKAERNSIEGRNGELCALPRGDDKARN